MDENLINKDASIAQEYYKIERYWNEAMKHNGWKLAVWVAHYPDIDLISRFLDMEETVFGESEDIFFKFNTVYIDDEDYISGLWREFEEWFQPVVDKRYDMMGALLADGYLKEPFVPDPTLKHDIPNLLSELERFRTSFVGVDLSFMIHLSSGFSNYDIGLWLNRLLKEDIPPKIRFVTIDIHEQRAIDSFSMKTRGKVFEIHPDLDITSALKNEFSNDAQGEKPHEPSARYRELVINVMENIASKKKEDVMVPQMLALSETLQSESLVITSYLIAAQVYYALKEYSVGMDYVETALRRVVLLDENTNAERYPLWRSCMMFKAAFLFPDKKREDETLEIYDEIAQEAASQHDYFYVMEAYRMCAELERHRKRYEKAFQYALLSLFGGSHLDITVRRNSTFVYVAGMAVLLASYSDHPEEAERFLKLQLRDSLGEDWKKLLDVWRDYNNHSVNPPVPEMASDATSQ